MARDGSGDSDAFENNAVGIVPMLLFWSVAEI